MKYMLLIHQGTTPLPGTEAWDALSAEQQGAIYAAYKALNETPGLTPGEAMREPATATTVRVRDDEVLTTDGPYAELKEAIGGYFHLECEDLDAAVAVAATVPAARFGGAVEVSPLGTYW